jgi:hypothetical protein
MKKEVAFFKDSRGSFSARNMIALYRSLGYTDKQIKEEMLKLKAEREQPATKYQVYKDEGGDGTFYGICDETASGILYDATFIEKKTAQAICDAHNNGAESYEQACAMAGLDPVTLEPVSAELDA